MGPNLRESKVRSDINGTESVPLFRLGVYFVLPLSQEQEHGLLAVFMGLGVLITHVTMDQTFLKDSIFFQYKKIVGPKKFSDPKFFMPEIFLRTKFFSDPNFCLTQNFF